MALLGDTWILRLICARLPKAHGVSVSSGIRYRANPCPDGGCAVPGRRDGAEIVLIDSGWEVLEEKAEAAREGTIKSWASVY
jgi:hypothetical protein